MAPISEYNSGEMGEALAVQAALPITTHYCNVQLGVHKDLLKGPAQALEKVLEALRDGTEPRWDKLAGQLQTAADAWLADPTATNAAKYAAAKKSQLCLIPMLEYSGADPIPLKGIGTAFHNGLYVYDLDKGFPPFPSKTAERRELALRIIDELRSHPHIVGAGASSSWGAFCLAFGPRAQDAADLHYCHEFIRENLLQLSRAAAAESQANPGRLRLVVSGRPTFYNGTATVWDMPGRPDPEARAPVSGGPIPSSPSTGAASREILLENGVIKDMTPAELNCTIAHVRSALASIPLPDNSHPVWIKIAYALSAGEDNHTGFPGQELFLEWTEANAYAGSTKPRRAAETYAGLRGRRRGTQTLGVLFTIAGQDFGWVCPDDGDLGPDPGTGPFEPDSADGDGDGDSTDSGPPVDPELTRGVEPQSLGDWPAVGRWLGGLPEIKDRWRYDGEKNEMYEFKNGTHWRFRRKGTWTLPIALVDWLQTNRRMLAGALSVLSVPGKGKLTLTDSNLRLHGPHGIATGLRSAMRRDFPDYPVDLEAQTRRRTEIAVPSGVVDLITGEVHPHNSAIHNTTAVTLGDYRPHDLERLQEVLQCRLEKILTADDYQRFVELLGLLGSGKAQSHRALWIFQGLSGSGKGGTAKLMQSALGQRATSIGTSFLGDYGGGEISAERYALLRDQPLLVVFDELNSESRVIMAKLLSLTGDNILPGARLPYMDATLKDDIPSVVLMSMVEPPLLSRGTGLDRRVYTLAFTRAIATQEKDDSAAYSRDLLDAVVTAMVDGAIATYKPGWVPPEPDPAAQRAFMAAADELAEWVAAMPEDWVKLPFETILGKAIGEVGPTVAANTLAKKIAASKKWELRRGALQGDRGRKLYLRGS